MEGLSCNAFVPQIGEMQAPPMQPQAMQPQAVRSQGLHPQTAQPPYFGTSYVPGHFHSVMPQGHGPPPQWPAPAEQQQKWYQPMVTWPQHIYPMHNCPLKAECERLKHKLAAERRYVRKLKKDIAKLRANRRSGRDTPYCRHYGLCMNRCVE